MITSHLRSIAENHVQDAGDTKEGLQRFATQMVEGIRNGIDGKRIGLSGAVIDYQNGSPVYASHPVSLRQVLEATVGVAFKGQDYTSWSAKQLSESLNSSQFPNITTELIHQTIMPGFNYITEEANMLVFEDNSDRPDYDYLAGLTAGQRASRVGQRMPFPQATVREKLARIQLDKFGEIIELSKELVIADRTGSVVRAASELGKKLGLIKSRLIFETAVDTTRTDLEESTKAGFYFDGSARDVYASTHTTLDSQTNNNTATNALETSALDTAYNYFSRITDEAGDIIVANPNILLVVPGLRQTAWNLTTAATNPSTANRADNFYSSRTGVGLVPRVVSSPYVGSGTTAWYLGAFSEEIVWLWGWRPQTLSQGSDSDAAFERDIVQRYRHDFKGGCGRLDYRKSYKGNA